MEKLNLVEILKDCPKGTPLYTTICGSVELEGVESILNNGYPITVRGKNGDLETVTSEGRLYQYAQDGECVLFPSKENRDWSQFNKPKSKYKVGDHFIFDDDKPLLTFVRAKGNNLILKELTEEGKEHQFRKDDVTFVEKFDTKFLKPFDKVLVFNEFWECAIFSHQCDNGEFVTTNCTSNFCIPYNEETKHLIGTHEREPEFYSRFTLIS